MEKLQLMMPVARGSPVHTVAQENYIFILLSIAAFVQLLFIALMLLLSVLQKVGSSGRYHRK